MSKTIFICHDSHWFRDGQIIKFWPMKCKRDLEKEVFSALRLDSVKRVMISETAVAFFTWNQNFRQQNGEEECSWSWIASLPCEVRQSWSPRYRHNYRCKWMIKIHLELDCLLLVAAAIKYITFCRPFVRL